MRIAELEAGGTRIRLARSPESGVLVGGGPSPAFGSLSHPMGVGLFGVFECFRGNQAVESSSLRIESGEPDHRGIGLARGAGLGHGAGMTADAERIADEILTLPSPVRAFLAHKLIASLDGGTDAEGERE